MRFFWVKSLFIINGKKYNKGAGGGYKITQNKGQTMLQLEKNIKKV